MAIVNRILIVLILLLALGATFLSWKLFERRDEFRGRSEVLAETVVDLVKTLDRDSATNVASQVSFTRGDHTAQVPEKGNLSWNAYHEAKTPEGSYASFNRPLDLAKKLAGDINRQRNYLADTIVAVATELEMPQGVVTPEDLKNASTVDNYEDSSTKLLHLSKDVRDRTNAMINSFVANSKTMGHPIDESLFRSREETVDDNGNMVPRSFRYRMPLADFSMNLTKLKTRADDYASSLVMAINRISKHEWETIAGQIPQEETYAVALTSLTNDFEKINEKLIQLERTSLELEDVRLKLEGTLDNLDIVQKDLADKQQQVVDQTAEINRLKARIDPSLRIPGADGVVMDLDLNMEGRVVQVNRDWNFVIIDLGAGKVQENMQMLVARDDQLLAKLQISKVYPNISVCEILPELNTGKVEPGDRVILPSATR